MRYTVERETPARFATASTLTRFAGAFLSRSITASMIRCRVSAAASARAFCSYARVTLCEPYHFHLTGCPANVYCRNRKTLLSDERRGNGMAMDAQEIDVLVVGAGPAGLTAAATLRRLRGRGARVVERKHRLSSHPRATVVSTRSMELLRSWGLEDEILAGGADVEWRARLSPGPWPTRIAARWPPSGCRRRTRPP